MELSTSERPNKAAMLRNSTGYLLKRIKAKMKVVDDCWIWTGSLNKKGYGITTRRGQKAYVHRLAYELMQDPIPYKMHIDHLCNVPACFNPVHLQVVTLKENLARGDSGSFNRNKQTCPQGHEYNQANTYHWKQNKNYRSCLECLRIRSREYQRKRRGYNPRSSEE